MLRICFDHPTLNRSSYLIADDRTHEALVIDPLRNIQPYLDSAKTHGLKIVAVIETHIHTDIVSGSRQLADATDCTVLLPNVRYGYLEQYKHAQLQDEDSFDLGDLSIVVRHIGGHTPEHIALYIEDANALFIGDALTHDQPKALANLPQDTRIYSSIGTWNDDTDDTLNQWEALRQPNHATDNRLQDDNLNGPKILTEKDHPDTLPPIVLRMAIEKAAPIVDARPYAVYAEKFLPNTINIEAGAGFIPLAKAYLDRSVPFYLIHDRAKPLVQDLQAAGLDKVAGTFRTSTFSTIARSTKIPFLAYAILELEQIQESLDSGNMALLDVSRHAPTPIAPHEQTQHIPIEDLPNKKHTLSPQMAYAVYSSAPHEAATAVSWLQKEGFDAHLLNIE